MASLTSIDICNRALTEIGSGTIESLSDNTKGAKRLAIIYDQALRELLEAHVWGFARKVATLPLNETDPASGWGYAYQLPKDCLSTIHLSVESDEYEVIGDELHTDREQAVLHYVAYIDDPKKYSPMFARALSKYLAVDLALTVSANIPLRDRLRKEFQEVWLQATKTDAVKDRVRESQISMFERARTSELVGGNYAFDESEVDY